MPDGSDALSGLREQLALDETVLHELADAVADARQTVADAEAALQQARREQRILEARMAQKQLDVDAQRQILCPVTRLPDEMLTAIMRVLHEECGGSFLQLVSYFDSLSAAVSCASVCKRWRRLALTCPWLWNHISVNGTTRHRSMLRLQLERSKPLALDIWIDCHEAHPEDNVFRDLLDQGERWRTFYFVYHALEDVLPRFQIPTPRLEQFILRCHENIHEPDECLLPGQALEFLPYAPKLHTLEIDACVLRRLAFIPRPSLRIVSLGECTETPPSLVMTLFGNSPSLENVEMGTNAPVDFAWSRPATHVSMSCLRELSTYLDLILACIDLLSLPALHCLDLHGYHSNANVDALFQNCSHIRRLSLFSSYGDERMIPGQLPSILAHLNKLETLFLYHFPFSPEDFIPLSMVDEATGTWMVPELKSLTMTRADMDRDAASSCVGFVRSRTVDNAGSGGARTRLTEITCMMDILGDRSSYGDLDWLPSVLSTMCQHGASENV